MELTPLHCIKRTNLMVQRALKNDWSRYSANWSLWSSEMNRKIKAHVEEHPTELLTYAHVFTYWQLSSEAIELARMVKSGKFVNNRRFNSILDLMEKIKKAVETGNYGELDENN